MVEKSTGKSKGKILFLRKNSFTTLVPEVDNYFAQKYYMLHFLSLRLVIIEVTTFMMLNVLS